MRIIRLLLLLLVSLALASAPASATITSTANTVVALGNGATTQFTFNFVGVKASDLVVTYTDASGNATVLTQGSQYTVSFTPTPAGSIWGVGGSVTYPLSGSPIATGTTLTISRQMPLTQTTSSNQGQLFPQAVEQGLDTGVMQAQQMNNALTHAIVSGVNDTCSSLGTLPSPVQRANQLLGFDSTGCNPIVAQPSSALVSSAMQPVVAASTIGAAQALLGIGTSASVPVGAEVDWPGLSAPTYWKLENGAALSRTGYPELLAALAPTVPCTITSGSSTITGLSSTVGWGPGWVVESPGSSALPGARVIATVASTSITIAGGAAIGNATSCQIFPYGTGQDGTFYLPNSAGVVYAGLDLAASRLNTVYYTNGNPAILNSLGGVQGAELTTPNLPPYTPSGTVSKPTATATPTVSGLAAQGGTSSTPINAGSGAAAPLNAGTISVAVDVAQPTFSGTAQGGTSAAFSIVQPTIIRNKIIFAGRP